MNYATADAKLGNRSSRKLENNTYLQRRDIGTIAVRLHNTDVITFCADGVTVLDSGGWRTVTTKDRINSYSDVKVFSVGGVWQVARGWDGVNAVLFADGMGVPADGPIEGESVSDAMRDRKRYNATVKRYVNAFCADVEANGLPQPSSGDCWGCYFRAGTKAGLTDSPDSMPMGWDHIASHFAESYFVPSLAIRALQSHGRNVGFIYSMYLAPDSPRRDASFLRDSLRYYLRKHAHDIMPHMEGAALEVAADR